MSTRFPNLACLGLLILILLFTTDALAMKGT